MNECQWFAGCHNEEAGAWRHPTLGWVPICLHHIEWLGDSPTHTQFVPPIAAATLRKVGLDG